MDAAATRSHRASEGAKKEREKENTPKVRALSSSGGVVMMSRVVYLFSTAVVPEIIFSPPSPDAICTHFRPRAGVACGRPMTGWGSWSRRLIGSMGVARGIERYSATLLLITRRVWWVLFVCSDKRLFRSHIR